MQKQIGVWIDLKKAVVVFLGENNHDLRTITSQIEKRERIPGETKIFARFGEQFLEFSKKKKNRLTNQIQGYLEKVVTEIKEADEIVLFGPANMKIELEKFIRKDKKLAGRVRAIRTTDSMTDNQIAAWVRSYYHADKS
jgi:hypothetical protein